MNTPFQQGYAAYAVRSVCPYPSHTEDASRWREGWWHAAAHTEAVLDALLRDRHEETTAGAWLRTGKPL